MDAIPREFLLLLLFGAFLVMNALFRRGARKDELEAAPDELLDEEVAVEVEEFERPAPVATRTRRPEAEAARAASVVRKGRRFGKETLLGNQRQVQDAFVVATILGRCRADEPHEVR